MPLRGPRHTHPRDTGPPDWHNGAIGMTMDTPLHHEAAERLSLVLEGTRLGMWDWNPQTDAVVFDARWAEMLGHHLDEIPFTLDSWSSRVHPDDLPACMADIRAHLEGHTDFYENVHRMRHKNGHWVYILDRGRISKRDDWGRPVRFSGTHTDISAQCEAEQSARALAQGRTRLLATMSHEIRTPLHGILGLVEMLGRTGLSAEQQRIVALVAESGATLGRLIDDVLDFSKAAEGALRIEAAPVALPRLLVSVLGLFRGRAIAKNLAMQLEIDPAVPDWVSADDHRLRQVLSNLLSNAVKFTAAGHIRLSARPAPGGLCFEVADTGVGMADPSDIFEPYIQARGVATLPGEGTGLGLAIVHQLAQAMGGDISVESRPGVGSCFTLLLPLATTPAPPAAPQPAAPALDRLSHLRVLVAEDNPVNQVVMRGMLEPLVAALHVVDTGRQAVETMRSAGDRYDVIIMDLNMPELDGDEAALAIRAAGHHQPILAATADFGASSDRAAAAGAFTAVLRKPFHQAALLQTLGQLAPPPV